MRRCPCPAGCRLDATVRCVVLCWPVIDPLGRYQYAKQNREPATLKKQADELGHCHDQYWAGEAAMAEGNPTLRARARRESADAAGALPAGHRRPAHPVPNRDRFVASYRKAGGRVELHLFEGMSQAFITDDPTSPATRSPPSTRSSSSSTGKSLRDRRSSSSSAATRNPPPIHNQAAGRFGELLEQKLGDRITLRADRQRPQDRPPVGRPGADGRERGAVILLHVHGALLEGGAGAAAAGAAFRGEGPRHRVQGARRRIRRGGRARDIDAEHAMPRCSASGTTASATCPTGCARSAGPRTAAACASARR